MRFHALLLRRFTSSSLSFNASPPCCTVRVWADCVRARQTDKASSPVESRCQEPGLALSLVEPELRSHRHRRSALATAPRIRCKEMVDMLGWLRLLFFFWVLVCVRRVHVHGGEGMYVQVQVPLNVPRNCPRYGRSYRPAVRIPGTYPPKHVLLCTYSMYIPYSTLQVYAPYRLPRQPCIWV